MEKMKEAVAALVALQTALSACIGDLQKITEGTAEVPEKAKGKRRKDEPAAPVNLDDVVIEHTCGCRTFGGTRKAESTYCAEHQKNIDRANAKPEPIPGTALQSTVQPSGEVKVEPAMGKAVLSGDVTIEMVRAKSTEYSAIPPAGFGIAAWKELCKKVTGVEKVKEIKPELYGSFFGAMDAELLKLKTAPPPAEVKPSVGPKLGATPAPAAGAMTKDQVKTAAKAFQDKNGEAALAAVLKAFGAKKISDMNVEKYPAFVEALQNA